MCGRNVRRGKPRGTAVSPAHPASFHRRPGRVDGFALKRDRICLRLAADLSNIATLIASAIALLHRSGHVRAMSNAKAVPLLPDPSLGTIAQGARELIATARSRASASTAAASEWPCTRPNFARNPSSSTGDGRQRIPEIGNGGIATEQFLRSWVATRKALQSSNRSCRSVPASSLSEFPSMRRCWRPVMPCKAKERSNPRKRAPPVTLDSARLPMLLATTMRLSTLACARCNWSRAREPFDVHSGCCTQRRGDRRRRYIAGSTRERESTSAFAAWGDAENRLKEPKSKLGLDRTSCHRSLAN